MPYKFAAESFHTKKLCSRLPSRKAQFFIRKMENFCFWGPLWEFTVHLTLIGKLVVDFLLVIIELFLLGAFVSSQYRCLHTDRQTEWRLYYGWTSGPHCIQRSAVKRVENPSECSGYALYIDVRTYGELKTWTQTFSHTLAVIFTGVKKCKMWPQFSAN